MGRCPRRGGESSPMRISTLLLFSLTAAVSVLFSAFASAQQRPARRRAESPVLLGRWDLTVGPPDRGSSSWLEVSRSGYSTLVGRYVGGGGSARPISQVFFEDNRFHFSLPVQWEQPAGDLRFEGQLSGDTLSGTMWTTDGKQLQWTGVRAPSLVRTREPEWGKPVELFNGRDLTGWRARNPKGSNGWVVEDGLLRNAKPGNDLVTTQAFMDFKLHAEFRYPRGSNSGIYLRGRYEAQIEDDAGSPPESHLLGGIYGFLEPRVNAAKRADEWQSLDITLVGREVTMVLNGEETIHRQAIPGITGGALDSREGEPGPLLLQGDHGRIDFRKISLMVSK